MTLEIELGSVHRFLTIYLVFTVELLYTARDFFGLAVVFTAL